MDCWRAESKNTLGCRRGWGETKEPQEPGRNSKTAGPAPGPVTPCRLWQWELIPFALVYNSEQKHHLAGGGEAEPWYDKNPRLSASAIALGRWWDSGRILSPGMIQLSQVGDTLKSPTAHPLPKGPAATAEAGVWALLWTCSWNALGFLSQVPQSPVLWAALNTQLGLAAPSWEVVWCDVRGCTVTRSLRLSATPWTAARQAPLSMEFFRQEYRSGLPFPPPGHPPDPGVKPVSAAAPALAVDSSPLSPLGSSFTPPRLIFTPKLFPQDGFRVQVCPLSKQSKTKWALFFLRPAGPQERVTLGILGREYISYMSSIPMLFTCFSDFFTLYLKIE